MEVNDQQKYRFLILGGNGFIGRNFVEFLINENIASKIRVVDKVVPQMNYFNERHKNIFSNKVVEYKSANLINKISCQKAFEDELAFDFVVNFAAETRLGHSEPVYEEGVYNLSINCAKESAKQNVRLYVELSSHQFQDKLINHSLDSTCDSLLPFTPLAKYKLKVEKDLKNIENLDYIIIRPALVYGLGDRMSLMPRIVISSVYKHLNETMKLLWNKDLKLNTVHVQDLCDAIWFCCLNGKIANIYNVVDMGNTTQGIIDQILSDIFSIQFDYWGNNMSKVILKTKGLDELIEEINDKHMKSWCDLCVNHKILNTPINPYLYKEMLQNTNLSLNGQKILSLGFSYKKPIITKELILEIITDQIKLGLFPDIL
ncbi:uncharacterized protein LOC128960428 [Oppia nitens]|uniref:uncharacterized protein LOC128960428 n=1 Tax=Oppia nitens TaxID=1686743 RepID=UPI0023DBCCFF|nr:uncharacterized protein LOC128960428 [Oppia nitens]